MKVCFIGLGSIARRHIRNIKECFGENTEIHVLRSGKGECSKKGACGQTLVTVYEDCALDSWYDAVFITNPTSLHYETLRRHLHRSNSFFIEKPVFDTPDADLSPFADCGKNFYIACPLRYTNAVQYLKENIDFSAVYAMRCIASSYLPQWRPGTDYRRTYSARKSMGGGVSMDLIHEWDYICYLLGKPLEVKSMIRKKSGLETDCDDIAVYIAEFKDKLVEVHLDYFGRKSMRRIELFARDDTIAVDLAEQKIQWLNQNRTIDLQQDRDDYQKRELLHFLDIMDGTCSSDNDLAQALEVLKISRGEE